MNNGSIQQGLLDAPTFSLWLSPDPAAEPAGSLMFGGTDSSVYTGILTPVPVISSKSVLKPVNLHLIWHHLCGVAIALTCYQDCMFILLGAFYLRAFRLCECMVQGMAALHALLNGPFVDM